MFTHGCVCLVLGIFVGTCFSTADETADLNNCYFVILLHSDTDILQNKHSCILLYLGPYIRLAFVPNMFSCYNLEIKLLLLTLYEELLINAIIIIIIIVVVVIIITLFSVILFINGDFSISSQD